MKLEEIIEKRGQYFAEELRLTLNILLAAHPAMTESIKYGLCFFFLKKPVA